MNSIYDTAIEQVQNAIYIEPWIKEVIEESLKKQIPEKWVCDRPNHWACPSCGTMMGTNARFSNYCYSCGQRTFMNKEEERCGTYTPKA